MYSIKHERASYYGNPTYIHRAAIQIVCTDQCYIHLLNAQLADVRVEFSVEVDLKFDNFRNFAAKYLSSSFAVNGKLQSEIAWTGV